MSAVNPVLHSPAEGEPSVRFIGAARSMLNSSSAASPREVVAVATSVLSTPCALFPALRKERSSLTRLFSASCELFALSPCALVQEFKFQLLCFQARAHSCKITPGVGVGCFRGQRISGQRDKYQSLDMMERQKRGYGLYLQPVQA